MTVSCLASARLSLKFNYQLAAIILHIYMENKHSAFFIKCYFLDSSSGLQMWGQPVNCCCCFFPPLVYRKTDNTNAYIWLKSWLILVSGVLSCLSEHDECLSGLHNCDENALCFNMVGGHSCSCKPGYTGNGTVCKGKHHCVSFATYCAKCPAHMDLERHQKYLCSGETFFRHKPCPYKTLQTKNCVFLSQVLQIKLATEKVPFF